MGRSEGSPVSRCNGSVRKLWGKCPYPATVLTDNFFVHKRLHYDVKWYLVFLLQKLHVDCCGKNYDECINGGGYRNFPTWNL